MISARYVARQAALLEPSVGAAGAVSAGLLTVSHLREVTAPTFCGGQGTRMPFAGSIRGRVRWTVLAVTPLHTPALPTAANTQDVRVDVHPGRRTWSPPV